MSDINTITIITDDQNQTVIESKAIEIIEIQTPGLQGAKGDAGEQGPPGPAGSTETAAQIKIKYESNANTNVFTDIEKTNLSAQSNTNTGDETLLTIQSKRPIFTVNGQSLEGAGDIIIAGQTGQPGTNGANGTNGVNGLGFTGGGYDISTGIASFTSTDGLGFSTSDLRGTNGTNGANGNDGENGTDGANGEGFTGGSYGLSSGIVTFTSDDGLGFATGDLRGVNGTNGSGFTGGSYDISTGIVSFTSNDGLSFSTADLRGADGTNGTNGNNGTNGADGVNGLGFAGGGYNAATGIVTFTSNDGLGFTTNDLRGANGTSGTNGTNGTNGEDGQGFTGGSYDASTGAVTFTSDDGLGFSTSDLNGTNGTNGTNGVDGANGVNGQGVATGGSSGQLLAKVDGTDYNTEWITPTTGTSISFFQVQDNSTSPQGLTTSFADVTGIWGTAFTGSGYAWDGTELTVTSASDVIEFNASAQGIVTGNNRVEVGLRLMADTGSGYVELTRVSQYALRNNANDEGNVTFGGFHVFNVVAGTKFKIQVLRVGSASSIGSQGGTYFNAKRYSVSTASGIQIEVVTEYPATPNAETLYLKVGA